jgi:hypothetical protein
MGNSRVGNAIVGDMEIRAILGRPTTPSYESGNLKFLGRDRSIAAAEDTHRKHQLDAMTRYCRLASPRRKLFDRNTHLRGTMLRI